MPFAFNPFTGTLDAVTEPPTGAALTRVNDTNVTLTLGGSPTTALLNAASLTVGWSGTLATTRGGSGAGSFTLNGVLYGNGSGAFQVTGAPGTRNVLVGNGGAPSWTDAPNLGGTLVLGSTAQSGGTTGVIYAEVGTGGVSVTTGAVTALKFDPTLTVGGNSAISLASLFNAQYTSQDDGTATRTAGPTLIFASQPTFNTTVASGLALADFFGIPAVAGLYIAPQFTRTGGAGGSGTGTATTVAGIHLSKFAAVNTGWTITSYVGMLVEVPSTLTGTISNFYGIKNTGAAATNFWFLYEGGGMQSSHKGSLRLGDNTAPGHVLELASDSAAKPSTNTWTVTSDARIKRAVRAYDQGLAEVVRIRPVRYRYNGTHGFPDDGQEHVGVIAQEIREVLPDTVTETDGLLRFNAHNVTFALINAVRELDARLHVLEAA